jgi:hypothetical protein
MIIKLVFEKNANFFAENWQKSQKIVTITSIPGHTAREIHFGSQKLVAKFNFFQTFFFLEIKCFGAKKSFFFLFWLNKLLEKSVAGKK